MAKGEPNEYSREAYDAAQSEVDEAKAKISPETPTDELRGAIEAKAQAEEKRGDLYEIAWDEALKLNGEYDQLWAQKEQAEQAVATFQREKLGVKEPETEEEKKEPTMEEQAGIYAEMFGVDAAQILEQAQSLQAEMSEKERKKLTMLVYAPEKFSTTKAWEMVKKENPTYEWINPNGIKSKGETEKAVVAFARYSQETDEDSLGEQAKSALDWEKTDQKFMSPKLRMIAGELYRRAEGKQMDEKNWTLCPGSRSERGYVPFLGFDPGDGEVGLDGVGPGYRRPGLGVRRVVSRELES